MPIYVEVEGRINDFDQTKGSAHVEYDLESNSIFVRIDYYDSSKCVHFIVKSTTNQHIIEEYWCEITIPWKTLLRVKETTEEEVEQEILEEVLEDDDCDENDGNENDGNENDDCNETGCEEMDMSE